MAWVIELGKWAQIAPMPQLSMSLKKKGSKMESLKTTPPRASSSFISKAATVLLYYRLQYYSIEVL